MGIIKHGMNLSSSATHKTSVPIEPRSPFYIAGSFDLKTKPNLVKVEQGENDQIAITFQEGLFAPMAQLQEDIKQLSVPEQKIVPSNILAILYRSGMVPEYYLPTELRAIGNDNSTEKRNASIWIYTNQLAYLEDHFKNFGSVDPSSSEPIPWYKNISFRGGIALNYLIENCEAISNETREQIKSNKEKLKKIETETYFKTCILEQNEEIDSNDIAARLSKSRRYSVLRQVLNINPDFDMYCDLDDFPEEYMKSSIDFEFRTAKSGTRILFIKGSGAPFMKGGTVHPSAEFVTRAALLKSRGDLANTELEYDPTGTVRVFNVPNIRNGRLVQKVNIDYRDAFETPEKSAQSILDLSKSISYAVINDAEYEYPSAPPEGLFSKCLIDLTNETKDLIEKIQTGTLTNNTLGYDELLTELDKRSKSLTTSFTEIYKSLFVNPELTISHMNKLGMISKSKQAEISRIFAEDKTSFDNKFVDMLGSLVGEENSAVFFTLQYYLSPNIFSEMMLLQNSNLSKKDEYGNMTYDKSQYSYNTKISIDAEEKYLELFGMLQNTIPFKKGTIEERSDHEKYLFDWDAEKRYRAKVHAEMLLKYPM